MLHNRENLAEQQRESCYTTERTLQSSRGNLVAQQREPQRETEALRELLREEVGIVSLVFRENYAPQSNSDTSVAPSIGHGPSRIGSR